MSEKRKLTIDTRVIFGLGIIFVGVILLLDKMGYHTGIDVWELWPVFVILVGFSLLARSAETRQTLSGTIIISIGVLFLLDNLDIIRYGIEDFWPIILILVGIMILFNAVGGFQKGPASNDFINLSFILGGGDFNFNTRDLKGGKISAIMGGGTVDLREADFQGEQILIDVFTCMGGIEIKVPKNWEVQVQGTPLLGGIDNKSTYMPLNNTSQSGQAKKKLLVKGMVIMGGMEIRN